MPKPEHHKQAVSERMRQVPLCFVRAPNLWEKATQEKHDKAEKAPNQEKTCPLFPFVLIARVLLLSNPNLKPKAEVPASLTFPFPKPALLAPFPWYSPFPCHFPG